MLSKADNRGMEEKAAAATSNTAFGAATAATPCASGAAHPAASDHMLHCIRRYVSATVAMDSHAGDSTGDSTDLLLRVESASSALANQISHLGYEFPRLSVSSSACSGSGAEDTQGGALVATPPVAGCKKRGGSKRERREAKRERRRKIVEKIRPMIERSQAMRRDLDREIQEVTGVTWGNGMDEPRYRDSATNKALSAEEYGHRYFNRYLVKKIPCIEPLTVVDTGLASAVLSKLAAAPATSAAAAAPRVPTMATEIREAEARCWKAIEQAMQRLDEERAAIRLRFNFGLGGSQAALQEVDSKMSDKRASASGRPKLSTSPVQVSTPLGGTDAAGQHTAQAQRHQQLHEDDEARRRRRRRERRQRKQRKQRRRSIVMQVPSLFEEDDEDKEGAGGLM